MAPFYQTTTDCRELHTSQSTVTTAAPTVSTLPSLCLDEWSSSFDSEEGAPMWNSEEERAISKSTVSEEQPALAIFSVGLVEQLRCRNENLKTLLQTLRDRENSNEQAGDSTADAGIGLADGDTVEVLRSLYRPQGSDVKVLVGWQGLVSRVDGAGDVLVDFGPLCGSRWVRGKHVATALKIIRHGAMYKKSWPRRQWARAVEQIRCLRCVRCMQRCIA